MALTSAEAEVRIVPSMRGFGEKVRAGVKSTRVDPLEIQVKLDRRSLDQAEQAARQAAQNVAKARDVERKASEDLRLAESRLADTRSRSGATASQLIAAENRLEQAKRSQVSASSAVQRAHADEARSKSAVISANDRLDASYRRLQRSTSGIAGAMRSVRGVMSNLGDNGSVEKTDRALSRAASSALRLGGTATVAATALVGIGGATGPVIALAGALASAAGSAALIPAALAGAGAAFGAVKLGVSGISEAFKGYSADQDAATKSSTKNAATELSNAKAIRGAKQAISDAQRDQARTARDGAEQIQAAHQRVSAAVEDEKLAQKDLQRAYKDAARELQDLWLARTGYSLDAESAQIAFERQQQRTDEIMRSSTATALDKREANNDLLQSQHRLFEAQERQKRGMEDYADAERKGIAGSDQVVSAQQRVKSAQDNVRDSKMDLARTERSAAEANQDAARRVSEAVQNLADTQSQQAAASDKATAAASKYNAALAKLSPNAQAFVRAVLGMKAAWDSMQRSVQDRLFAGTADEVRLLGEKYMPILRQRLGDIAGSFNTAALETSGFLRSADGVRMVDTTLANTSKTTDQLARAAAPLTNIFLRFSEIGSAYLPALASKFADAAERAAAFVNSAEGSAKIKGWIEGGLQALSQLWQLLKNVGGIMSGVFYAMNTAGTSTLQTLVDLTAAARNWVQSGEGQQTLVKVFTTIRDVVNELKPGVAAVLGAIKDAFLTLAPSLPGAARAFSDIAKALAPLVGWIAQALKWLIDEGLIPLGEWAKKYPGSFQAAAVAVLAVVAAVKALNMAKSVMNWATGIADAFGVIRKDADKASDAVGRDGKSGLRGRLGALKNIGKFTIGITLLFFGLEVLHEVSQWIKDNNPGENKLQKDRTLGEETAHVGAGIMPGGENPFDAFKNRKGSPFEVMFGQTPEQFAESVKNSMFGKLSDKFDNTIGKWLTDHISNPVKKFFAEDIPNWFDGLFGGGEPKDPNKPPAQGAIGGAQPPGGGGKGFLDGLLPEEGVGTWMSDNVGTPISDFFTNLPSTINTGVISPIFTGMKEAWNGALWAMTWTWDNVLKPAWDGIVFVATWLYYNVLLPIWNGMKAAWDGLLWGMKWTWDNVLKPVWDGIVFVATWLYYNVLLPIWNGMKAAWDGVLFGMKWTWDNILKPVWDAISFAATWLYYNILLPVWNAMKAAWDAVLFAMKWTWDNILKPVWDAISFAATWLYLNVLLPVWNAMKAAWDAVLFAMKWTWDNILKPAWDAIAFAANWLWLNVLLPAWNAMKAAWDGLLFAMKWAWDNILKPVWDAVAFAANWLWINVLLPIWNAMKAAWDGLARAFQWVYDNIIAPVLRAFEGGVRWFSDKFHELVDGLKRKWDELREAFRGPINWVIDVVWNKGVGGLWGKARELIPALPEFHNAPGFASGGLLRGPGTGTSDSILGLSRGGVPTARVSNGEFVVNEKVTRKTLPFLRALNSGEGEALQAAGGLNGVVKKFRGRSGFDQNLPPGFAAGGPVDARIAAAKQWLSGEARGIPYVYGGPTSRSGTDCSGMVAMVTHILSGRSPYSGRMGGTGSMPWGGFVPGLSSAWAVGNKPNDHMAGTLAGDNVEQHGPNGTPFSFPSRWGADASYFTQQFSLPVVGGQFVSGGSGGGIGNWILDKITGLYNDITNPIRALAGSLFPTDTLAHRIPKDGTNQILDAVRDKLFGAAGDYGGGDVSGISGPVVDQVKQVAARFGWGDGAQWGAIYKLVMGESSWNPNNANPTSSARGLFQKMTGIHGPIEPTPAGQAQWGLNYIKDTYGDPINAFAKWSSRNPHWYHTGGTIPGQGDRLVLAEGGERVLTTEQNAWLESALRAASMSGAVSAVNRGAGLGSLVGASPVSGERGPLIGEFHAHETVDVDRAVSRVAFLSGAP